MQRSVLIFPALTSLDAVTAVRRRYDPLVENIRPHVSLVFPFDSPAPDSSIVAAVAAAAATTPAFTVAFDRLGGDWVNGYFWLAAGAGAATLTTLHDRLYRTPLFRDFLRSDLPYRPHITLGKVAPAAAAGIAAGLHVADLASTSWVTAIACERILPNGDSDVFATLPLAR
ncbi:2'-5' RNA ligase family protein [Lacticaseibacillus parakribbianus]|uniref:2'-5' RNA ligase family protein n=1 Tax=Lacticaseibacillus parakribbianus TaxID=2970927 RepID=UPI0021CB593C|nr:2'-5' RNA ligase family protein [Lacticaseibacillus parakribbianus]